MPVNDVYMDTSSFATATALWSNSSLTTKAPNGVYAICGYWRRQTNLVLEPGIYKCADECDIPCGTTTGYPTINTKGWFRGAYDTGSALGAIRIEMINYLAQPIYYMCELGQLAFPDSSIVRRKGRTYIGAYIDKMYTFETGATISCNPESGIISGLTDYRYNPASSFFLPTGGPTNTEYITSMTDIPAAATLIMYIPKTTNAYNMLDYTIIQPCVSGYQATLKAFCPVLLPEMKVNGPHGITTPTAACSSTGYPLAVYQGHTNGIPGTTWGLYDWVFLDPYSEKIAPDGWYKGLPANMPSPEKVFYVEAGVIRLFDDCIP